MASDIVPPIPIDAPFASYNWIDWYQQVRRAINEAQDLRWNQFTDFTGSNLNQIVTRNHNDLQSMQGGALDEKYHLTEAQNIAIENGITTVITIAKLTGGGANGSMTFTNGILTASTPAT